MNTIKRISLIIALLLYAFLHQQCAKDDDSGLRDNSCYNCDKYNDDDHTQGETYEDYQDNPFVDVSEQAVSTFAVDADGGAYSNMRRYLRVHSMLPPKSAVRIEEFINYFNFDYPDPADGTPIALTGEVCECPWAAEHKIIRIGIKGKTIPENELPPTNYVLLVDVSGSMSDANKLPLLKESFKLLVDEMTASDYMSIVTYASADEIVLQPTSGANKETIKAAIDKLGSGGGTAGSKGIETAYELAEKNLIEGGNNRIILASDGDFNIGIVNHDDLIKLIEQKRDKSIFLTALGVGAGNYNDSNMEQIANHGNGTYEYIDKIEQAEKLFIYEYQKFFTVAKDCKVQIEFNPEVVSSYRLIGYENRVLSEEDFENDTVDAGEVGGGQTITALYEIIPNPTGDFRAVETFSIDFRYKLPTEDISRLAKLGILDKGSSFENASENMRFACAVAGFGMLLRDSPYKGTVTYTNVKDWVNGARTFDPYGFRREFAALVADAINMAK